jgi:hypothetical protein
MRVIGASAAGCSSRVLCKGRAASLKKEPNDLFDLLWVALSDLSPCAIAVGYDWRDIDIISN